MKPFIHLFKTPSKYYFYDVNRNENLAIDRDLYDYLSKKLYKSEQFVRNERLESQLKNLTEQGYLSVNTVNDIKHPATDSLNYYLSRKLHLLTIQLTHDCNLRCSYCAYTSNDGTYRLHQKKTIPFDTIKKSLHILRDNSVDSDSVTVGFYGGEPLIEYDLIKKTIEYTEKIFMGKEVNYTVTTNGTLFDQNILELLNKYNFSVVISLDGPKEINDKNRKFLTGSDSVFDEVIKNIIYISENYQNLFSKLAINMVMDPTQDFKKYKTLFTEYPALNKVNIMSTLVEDGYKTEKYNTTENFNSDFNYVHFLSYLHYLGEISLEDNPFYLSMFFQATNKMCEPLRTLSTLGDTNCPSGPCVPGNNRLMVSVDGLFFPCERISENIDFNCIGNVDTGLDLKRAEKVMNVSRQIKESCKKCFAFRHCSLCVKAHEARIATSKEITETCNNVRFNFHKSLVGKEILKEILF